MTTHNEDMKTLIDNAVGSSDRIAKEFDELLELPIDVIPIPKSVLEGVKTVLVINANLVQRLFAENQDIMRQVDEIVQRHKTK